MGTLATCDNDGRRRVVSRLNFLGVASPMHLCDEVGLACSPLQMQLQKEVFSPLSQSRRTRWRFKLPVVETVDCVPSPLSPKKVCGRRAALMALTAGAGDA